jgi:signal transduction histidine kinase
MTSMTIIALLVLLLLVAVGSLFLTFRAQRKLAKLAAYHLKLVDLVVHEVKSPLASIIGYANLINNHQLGPLDDLQKEPLAIIERQSQRILNIVQDYLDITRLETGHKLEKKPTDLAAVAAGAIERAAPQLAAKHLTVVKEFDPKIPPIMADENKISVVFANLLSNAAKFSNDGGRVVVAIAREKDQALVSVKDEGLEIAPADLPQIFDKFFNPNKESAAHKETGMGLALCKLIVEKGHGGRLWAASGGTGKGTIFHFVLPFVS